MQDLSPALRIVFKSVFSDTVEEFLILHKTLSCHSDVQQTEPSEMFHSNTRLLELNQLFLEALIKLNSFQEGHFVCHFDGSCRKLSDSECLLREFLTELDSKIKIFKTLQYEIEQFGTFESLKSDCENTKLVMDMPLNLAKSVFDNNKLLKFLQDKIGLSKVEYKKRFDLHEKVIEKLKHELQETNQLSEMYYNYLHGIYKQRAEELERNRNEEISNIDAERDHYIQLLNTEKRVIYEDSSCMLSLLDSHKNRLKYLQTQTKVQDLKTDLENLINNLNQLRIDHEKLINDYDYYNQVVQAYDDEQEKLRQMRKQEEDLAAAIYKIQAWWRAMIVLKNIKVPSLLVSRKKRRGKSAARK